MLNKDDFSKKMDKRIERMAEDAKDEINRMAEQAHRNIEQNFKIAMMEMRLHRLERGDKPAAETAPAAPKPKAAALTP